MIKCDSLIFVISVTRHDPEVKGHLMRVKTLFCLTEEDFLMRRSKLVKETTTSLSYSVDG